MNTIGRVFLVLNLGLAGAFVGFAGTYLERADNWKQKFIGLEKASTQEIDTLKASVAAQRQNVENEKRVVANLDAKVKGLQTKLDEKERVNASQERRLGEFEGTIKKMDSSLAKTASAIETAQRDAKTAMDRAIAAEAAKDDAVTAKNAALKQLSDANFKIQNQDKKIGDQMGNIAKLGQTVREKDVLLDIVARRYPGIFETLHPLVTGAVSHVGASGKLVTIALESGAENLKAGARFAIYSGKDGYKGEATVSEIDGSKKFCFARVTLDQGKSISAGDSASTNLTGARGN